MDLRSFVGGTMIVVAALTGGAQAATILGQGTWETTLQPRDLNGAGVADAFYDTILDITWLRDANLNGQQSWADATSWASALTIGGVSGWRLPAMVDTGAPGCDFALLGTDCGQNVQTKDGSLTKYSPGQTVYSEMAHLFYVTLGNKSQCAPADYGCPARYQAGWGLTNIGAFLNLQGTSGSDYWSNLLEPERGAAWSFRYWDGSQQNYYTWFSPKYAMVVRSGDVLQVPEPKTYIFLLAGLASMVVVMRRRRSDRV